MNSKINLLDAEFEMSGVGVDGAILASREEETYCSIGRKKLFQRVFIYSKRGLPVHFYIINENEDTWKVYRSASRSQSPI